MKQLLTYIFSLIVISTNAQVTDNFSDGDFTGNPAWSGTTGNFTVNADYRLQLNAANAGESFLSLPVNLNSHENLEWSFYISLDFSPSTSNYSRVYLSSDQSDLTQPLNGYFIQFGEALSNDAIELFRQDGSAVTSVCRGTNGAIATSFEICVRVLRDSLANWKMYADYSGGNNYQLEASGTDAAHSGLTYAGVKCVYTSGNIDNFIYDDFYFGPEILDTVPPSINSIHAATDSSIVIVFSERVDDNSANTLSNYSVDHGIGQPVLISVDSTAAFAYILSFENRFQGGLNNNLTVSGVKDLSQNQISSLILPFIYTPISLANSNDIIINEVYCTPSTVSPLPYAEYIEIYNRIDTAIELKGWTISDGSTDGIIPTFILGPHQYALFFDCDDASLFSGYSNAYCVESFPSLNNDGDEIKLVDENGIIINELKYDASMYGDYGKDDGGWSLERIDAGFICTNTGNWRASVSSLHGTPSAVNSVNGFFADRDSPFITNVYLLDSLTLIVLFSEEVSENANDLLNYKITSQDGTQLNTIQLVNFYGDSVVIKFISAVPGGINFIQASDAIHDCPGNALLTFRTVKFGYPQPANEGDIIINELLFYCQDGGNDFVELYNNSGKIIDLKDWTVSESDSLFLELKETARISSGHKLIFPGEYLVLSEEQKKVKAYYLCRDEYCFTDIHSMPDFSSEEGGVIISDNAGNMVSTFSYNDDMHFPLIKETRGVSLERMSFYNEENNWHSAAATAGFATPGYLNSQSIGYASGDGGFSLSSEIFSPDGDGYNDVLALHYRCEQTGSVLSLNVYDVGGVKVRTVLNQQTINLDGDLFWDGLADDRKEVPVGMYIILVRGYDLNGNNQIFKKGIFLTRNSN